MPIVNLIWRLQRSMVNTHWREIRSWTFINTSTATDVVTRWLSSVSTFSTTENIRPLTHVAFTLSKELHGT